MPHNTSGLQANCRTALLRCKSLTYSEMFNFTTNFYCRDSMLWSVHLLKQCVNTNCPSMTLTLFCCPCAGIGDPVFPSRHLKQMNFQSCASFRVTSVCREVNITAGISSGVQTKKFCVNFKLWKYMAVSR